MKNTIRKLIDWKSKKVSFQNNCDAFGNGVTTEIPYAYMGKRLDAETGLIYFGKRFYDPSLGRWITKDPLGNIDHSNLYQYVFNNPFRYIDPYGENVFGVILGVGEILLGGTIMITGVGLEIATFGGYTLALGFHEAAGLSLIAAGCATTAYHAQDIKTPDISWKSIDIYVPDRPLPLDDKHHRPVPETDAPHTELGTRKGSKGDYPQAREFDEAGNPVKDIDFTDHGYPNHPIPHQHRPEPNPSGGTPKRGSPEPLPTWSY